MSENCDPNSMSRPTPWLYARREIDCQCICVVTISMPIVRGTRVDYMAVCPDCNRRKYISCTIDDVDLRGFIIASED